LAEAAALSDDKANVMEEKKEAEVEDKSLRLQEELKTKEQENTKLQQQLLQLKTAKDSSDAEFEAEKNQIEKVNKLQEELKRMKEETLHYRLEAERVEKQRDHEVNKLYAEIQMLRVECTTNMEVLTKKGRELFVLRDSLKVEDDEVANSRTDGLPFRTIGKTVLFLLT
jgi:hypothetical protein